MASAVQPDRIRDEVFSVAEHLRADTVMVSAMDMLDILAAIKADLIVAVTLAGPNETLETHRRLKRLSETIEVATTELKALAETATRSPEGIA